jgi:Flp pilus assembly protein TadG
VTALEFAMVSCALIPMLLVMVEVAMQSATAAALDHAAQKAARAGSLGRENADGTRSGQACHAAILAAARQAGGGLLNGNLQLTVSNYGSAGSAVTAGPGRKNATSGAGLGGRTVVYELRYDQPTIFTKPVTTPWGTIGRERFIHTAVFTIQNEPFAKGDPDAPPCA